MLRPSYTELMDIINNEENIDMKITSRYTIVIAAARRARQLIEGERPVSRADSDKAVSLAIKEISQGRLAISAARQNEKDNSQRPVYSDEEYLHTNTRTRAYS